MFVTFICSIALLPNIFVDIVVGLAGNNFVDVRLILTFVEILSYG